MQVTAKAILENIFDVVNTKTNGKQFITTKARIIEGPAKGMTVLATRTLGDDKSQVSVGQEVTLHGHMYEGQLRFEIQTGIAVSNAADVLAAFGVKAAAPQGAEVVVAP